MSIRTYRDLDVWQKSMDLVVEIYRLTRLLPSEEQFGLASQMQRAAVSIPANIAEWHGQLHKLVFLKHLSAARGSLTELETHLQIAVRLDYLNRDQAKPAWLLLQDVSRLLNGLIRALRTSTHDSPETQIHEDAESYEFDTDQLLIPDPRLLAPARKEAI